MAKTIYNGALVSGTGLTGTLSNPIHTGAGRVIALIITHQQASHQQVILYDATSLPAAGSEIASFHVTTLYRQIILRWPRDEAIPFTTGLCVDAATCDVQIWTVGYG